MVRLIDGTLAYLTWPFVLLFLYVRFWISFIVCLPWFFLALAQGKSFDDFVGFYSVLEKAPFGLGKYLYTGFTGFFSPNNCLFTPVIVKLNSNECIASQTNYPWHRNPFGSMHAICLTSMAEYISAVAMMGAFQAMKNVRGIPISIKVDFHSKCKGEARAVLAVDPKMIKEDTKGNSTWENKINIFNPQGEICCEVFVLWKLEHKKEKKKP